MSDEQIPKVTEGWARPKRAKGSLTRSLGSDVRAVRALQQWQGPEGVTAEEEASAEGTEPSKLHRRSPLRAAVPPIPRGMKVETYGLHRVPKRPVIFVANHPSAHDAQLVLSALDAKRRARTVVVCVRGDDFPVVERLRFPTVRIDYAHPERAEKKLLDRISNGWNVLFFPEGGASVDGSLGTFYRYPTQLAEQTGLPIVPVGIRGAFAALNRSGKGRVSVRFGTPVELAGEDPRRALWASVKALIDEDADTWWQVVTGNDAQGGSMSEKTDKASWRQVWQQTAPPEQGGVREQLRIWR